MHDNSTFLGGRRYKMHLELTCYVIITQLAFESLYLTSTPVTRVVGLLNCTCPTQLGLRPHATYRICTSSLFIIINIKS